MHELVFMYGDAATLKNGAIGSSDLPTPTSDWGLYGGNNYGGGLVRNVMHGDGCEPEVLQAAGIALMDMVTALTGHDEDNLVACFLSKLQNVPLVLGRVNDPRNEWLFNKSWGVDISISSISLITSIVQEEVNLGEIITLLKLRVGNLAIEELTVAEGTKAIGKNLAEIDFPPNTRVMAVISGNQARVPAGGTVLEEGDRLLLLADTDEKSQLRDSAEKTVLPPARFVPIPGRAGCRRPGR